MNTRLWYAGKAALTIQAESECYLFVHQREQSCRAYLKRMYTMRSGCRAWKISHISWCMCLLVVLVGVSNEILSLLVRRRGRVQPSLTKTVRGFVQI